MKIALLSFEYPPETGFGGIGTYTWYQARALVKLGHQVDVLSGASETTPLTSYEHDGVRVFRFKRDGFWMSFLQLFDKLRLWWSRNRLENALSMYSGLRRLCEKNRYDIVEMPECGAEGLLINHLMKIKTIMRLHSPARLIMPYYDVCRSDVALCSRIEQLALQRVKVFSCCSQFLAEEARNKLTITRAIHVIPNGIDLELFDAEEEVDVRKHLSLPQNCPIILFSGRMENRKGIRLCTEIASSILERFEVAFVFAGRDLFGYMSNTLIPHLKTKKLRGSFHYVGGLNQKMVRSSLRQSDIFLLPSLWENCPYSCLEAMAARCAVVSTNVGGMPEMIEDGNHQNGLLAQNGNVDSYISRIEELLEDSALRMRLAEAGRRKVERSYVDTHIARLTVDLYQNYISCIDPSQLTIKDRLTESPAGNVE
jgi:glycogen(starch) synthase